MKGDDYGKPICGTLSCMLGVRVPRDVDPDQADNVNPDDGGMSVSPSLHTLPFFLVPRRLEYVVAGAAGNNSCFVWRYGDGPFVDSPVSADLRLAKTNEKHGVVAPAQRMHITQFLNALALTKDDWTKDEVGTAN